MRGVRRRVVLSAGVPLCLAVTLAIVSMAAGASGGGSSAIPVNTAKGPAPVNGHAPGFTPFNVGLTSSFGASSTNRGPQDAGPPSPSAAIGAASGVSPADQQSAFVAHGFPAAGSEVSEYATQYSNTFATASHGYVTKVYAQPVNYQATAGGSWQPIDDQLKSENAEFVNRADSDQVSIPKTLGAGESVRMADPNGGVSMALVGGSKVAAAVHGNHVVFADVLPGVSVGYQPRPASLKESLTLASVAAVPAGGLRFRLDPTGNLTPAVRDGSVVLSNRHGRVRFVIPAASMIDAAGKRSLAVSTRLVHRGGRWVLTVRPSRQWLTAKGRKWPVVVDPSVDEGATGDCYLNSAAPTTAACASPDGIDYVGNDSGYKERTVLAFGGLTSALPADSQVLNAELAFYVGGIAGSAPTIAAYPLTKPFVGDQVTWDNATSSIPWATPGGDVPTGTPAFPGNYVGYTTPTTAGTFDIPMTALTQSWIDGATPNDGVLLASYSEATAGYDVLSSSSGGQAPELDVNWIPRLGTPVGSTINSTQLDDRMSLGVNVTNGNALVSNSDISVNSVGLDNVMDRTYNNLSPFTGMGYRWTNAIQEPVLLGYADSIAVVSPDSTIEVFTYDWQTNAWVPPAGADETFCSATTCTGLPSGAAYQVEDRGGDKTEFNSAGLWLSVTDQNGNSITAVYSGATLTGITDSEGRTLSVSGLSSVTDPSISRSVNYTYTDGYMTSFEDENSNTTSYGYNAATNLTQITDPDGHITTMTYDSEGRIKTVTQVTNPSTMTGDTTSYAYNSPGTAFTGSATGCPNESVAGGTYLPAYGQTVVTNPRGYSTVYCYDTTDRVYAAYDHEGNLQSSQYTPDGHVTQFTDANGNSSNATYDEFSRQCSGSEAASATGQNPASGMQYTADNDPYTSTGTPGSGTPEDPDYTSSKTSPPNACYQGASGATAPPASDTNPYNPIYSIDSQGNEQKLGYNSNNDLTSMTPEGSSTADMSATYNANGTVATTKDGDGNQTTYTYYPTGSPYGRPGDLETITPPSPLGATTYKYDAASRVLSVTDGKSQTTSYTYDNMDRVTQITYNDGSTIKNTYDADGNLTKSVDSVAGTSSYTYNDLNQLTAETLATGTSHSYTYDPDGDLATSVNAAGTTTYGYDADDNNSSVLDPGASTATTLAYDKDGHVTCTTLPNGIVIQNLYLNGGELQQNAVLKPGATCSTTLSSGNELTLEKYNYTTSARHLFDTGLIQSQTNVAGTTTNYSYNDMNELTGVSGGGVTRTYSIDGAGNITKSVNGSTTTTMAFNAANELCWVYTGTSTNACGSPPSGAVTYSYDSDGNETGNSNGLALAYNARNQTTTITPAAGSAQTLTYTGGGQGTLNSVGTTGCPSANTTLDNNLVGINTSTLTTETPNALLGCLLPTTTSTATNYDRAVNGQELDQTTGSTTLYPLVDPLGSITALTNGSGAVADTTAYDPYGNVTSSTGTDSDAFSFQGGLQAPGGLIKFGDRYYDPTTMRWTQVDPTGQSPGYIFAGDDPINSSDPTGLDDARLGLEGATRYATYCHDHPSYCKSESLGDLLKQFEGVAENCARGVAGGIGGQGLAGFVKAGVSKYQGLSLADALEAGSEYAEADPYVAVGSCIIGIALS
jgi:RHS repeat-associated protein